MQELTIGIIGGTGVYENACLEKPEEIAVKTDYGEIRLYRGRYREREIYLLNRHGPGHNLPPHLVNYRANIAALKDLGVDAVIATAAAGSMRRELIPGCRMVIDGIVDFTWGRPSTFYTGGDKGVVHADLTRAYCPRVRRAILRASRKLGEKIIDGGCYICTEGPRFETPAEIKIFAQWGCDVVGMTNMPEVTLAREAGLCYAAIALVTNFAAGISDRPLSHQEVLEEMERGRNSLERLLVETAAEIEPSRSCGCPSAAGPWPPGGPVS